MSEEKKMSGFRKTRDIGKFQKVAVCFMTLVGIGASVFYLFYFRIGGETFSENGYLYFEIACFLPLAFLLFPATKDAPRDRLPWYDIILIVLSLSVPFYLFIYSVDIYYYGWETAATAPQHFLYLSLIMVILALEGGRRTGGLVLAAICLFFTFFPIFTAYMPGPFQGANSRFWPTMTFHALSCSGLVGIPMQAVSRILIGFMLFASALIVTGGGKFFLNLALALMGSMRGGAAKVSIVSSAFFGSLSGSALSNVVTTGAMTIPSMKQTGYAPDYAGATEACASTGGVLMPPVMGAVAFIMAQFTSTPYIVICGAAVIPSILYYLGLIVQSDAYAARHGLKGLPREDLPSLRQTLKEGWFFVFAFLLLIYLLVFQRLEAQAPFYASVAIIALSFVRKETRPNLGVFVELLQNLGRILAEIFAIVLGIELILSAMSLTGVGHSFSYELIKLSGGNIALLLMFGALASFVLGMGMTVSACYIFLAVILAPALIQQGLNLLATHLFIVYWGTISYITPPVALAAFAGAGLAGAPQMKTGFRAMRLGFVMFFIPFFFVLSPSLVLQAPLFDVLHDFSTCALGVFFCASSLEGYLIGIGNLKFWNRIAFLLGGFAMAMPGTITDFIGCAVVVVTGIISYILFGSTFIASKGVRNK